MVKKMVEHPRREHKGKNSWVFQTIRDSGEQCCGPAHPLVPVFLSVILTHTNLIFTFFSHSGL